MSDPTPDDDGPVDIKELRRLLGLPGEPISQGELGQKMGGLSQSTVSRMEENPALQKGPKLQVLRQLMSEATCNAQKTAA